MPPCASLREISWRVELLANNQPLAGAAWWPRYLAREQARRIAMFAGMPGWLTEHVCGLHGPGFEAGERECVCVCVASAALTG